MLEGGYDLKALGESVSNSFLALVGKDARDSFNPAVSRPDIEHIFMLLSFPLPLDEYLTTEHHESALLMYLSAVASR